MIIQRLLGSLRWRLFILTVITLVLALVGAHIWLTYLFKDHVQRQFDESLKHQLVQVTALLEFDEGGQPQIDPRLLSDPRWNKPYSGLYWQVDRHEQAEAVQIGQLRSRSLWDQQLLLPIDALPFGTLHWHDLTGPRGEPLRVVERLLSTPDAPGRGWRVVVAADGQALEQAQRTFSGVLLASLTAMAVLLGLAALAQSWLGLAPLRSLQVALTHIKAREQDRLTGDFPHELQGLTREFNSVLDQNEAMVARARTQAGNLAHALKTPLAVMSQLADQARGQAWSEVVREQVQAAEHHVQWHLARARAAAHHRLTRPRTPLGPVLQGLIRAMKKIHGDRQLDVQIPAPILDDELGVAREDLQQLLGNLIDNACVSARSRVWVNIQDEPQRILIEVNDDGPGIAPEFRNQALLRGVRLDEQRPGSGLGLAIVNELAHEYQGDVQLLTNREGGLLVRLWLPKSSHAN